MKIDRGQLQDDLETLTGNTLPDIAFSYLLDYCDERINVTKKRWYFRPDRIWLGFSCVVLTWVVVWAIWRAV